jgi:hypothetical protein|tara:strand:- start:2 stop:424 length:423 start_codon:yes stop_codon:yes gene_type:complete
MTNFNDVHKGILAQENALKKLVTADRTGQRNIQAVKRRMAKLEIACGMQADDVKLVSNYIEYLKHLDSFSTENDFHLLFQLFITTVIEHAGQIPQSRILEQTSGNKYFEQVLADYRLQPGVSFKEYASIEFIRIIEACSA